MKKIIFLILLLTASATFGQQVKINGRIQFDVEALKGRHDTAWTIGNEFRRVHLSAAGKLKHGFDYKVEANWAHASIGFRDMFIRYTSPRWGQIAVGAMPEPTGLAMSTSSKYITFMERPMMTALQNFRWGAGLHYAYHKLAGGRGGIQLALTNKGSNGEGFVDKHLEKGVNSTGRIYFTPYYASRGKYLIHLGLNGASRPPADLKFRAENHMGEKFHYVFPGATRRLEQGAELAFLFNNISLQGEYKNRNVHNDTGKDYQVTGYYLMLSMFLTGEHRMYKHGGFGRVKPYHPIGRRGWGAWELAFRYSQMDVSSDVLAANPAMPATLTNWTVGLNWYLTAHVRVMYNYILTNDKDPRRMQGHLVRFQMDF